MADSHPGLLLHLSGPNITILAGMIFPVLVTCIFIRKILLIFLIQLVLVLFLIGLAVEHHQAIGDHHLHLSFKNNLYFYRSLLYELKLANSLQFPAVNTWMELEIGDKLYQATVLFNPLQLTLRVG